MIYLGEGIYVHSPSKLLYATTLPIPIVPQVGTSAISYWLSHAHHLQNHRELEQRPEITWIFINVSLSANRTHCQSRSCQIIIDLYNTTQCCTSGRCSILYQSKWTFVSFPWCYNNIHLSMKNISFKMMNNFCFLHVYKRIDIKYLLYAVISIGHVLIMPPWFMLLSMVKQTSHLQINLWRHIIYTGMPRINIQHNKHNKYNSRRLLNIPSHSVISNMPGGWINIHIILISNVGSMLIFIILHIVI